MREISIGAGLAGDAPRVSSYSQITRVKTRVILNKSSYNSSYSRITQDSDPTIVGANLVRVNFDGANMPCYLKQYGVEYDWQ